MTEPPAHGVAHRHTSDTNEHYTPSRIVAPVTRCFGGAIDLDPASCELANEYIGAETIYTIETDGLSKLWRGRVFLNPPGGLLDENRRRVFIKTKTRESCSVTGQCGLPPGPDHVHHGVESSALVWWRKLVQEYEAQRVSEAFFVAFSYELIQVSVNASLDGKVFSTVEHSCVWLAERVRYLREVEPQKLVEGKSPPGGSFLVYLGRRPAEEIAGHFGGLGFVTPPAVRPRAAA